MTEFYFLAPGETLNPALGQLGIIGVPISAPPSAPASGSAWVIGSPEAVQVNGAWQQNWVQQAIPLADAQAAAIATVESTLEGKIGAGFTYSGTTIGISPADIVNINSMASQALLTLSPPAGVTPAAWPSGFEWLPQGSGAPIPLTAPEMLSMANACAHYVSALILYADTLAAQIRAATTSAGVAAVLSGASWPTS